MTNETAALHKLIEWKKTIKDANPRKNMILFYSNSDEKMFA